MSILIIPISGILQNWFSQTREQSFQIGMFISLLTFLHSQNQETIDGVSYSQVQLTTFQIPIVILSSWKSIQIELSNQITLIQQIEIFCLGVFVSTNLLIFYICFEAVLIPLFLLIGIYGSRTRKIQAAYSLFLYTQIGSLFMFMFLLSLYWNYGSFDYYYLKTLTLDESTQLWYWWPFFLSLAIKIPMVPFHIWQPEAHVEAPTAGSVLLAGIILKQGGYGIYRFLLPFFPYASMYFQPVVWVIGLIGILGSSQSCLGVTDIKKAIAYSSVGHMNLAIQALFSGNEYGQQGSLYFMISHGQVSSGLFLIVGMLYDRYGTKTIFYYRGLCLFLPILTVSFFFFSQANIAFPGTSSFVAEVFCYMGIWSANPQVGLFAATSVILTPQYQQWYFHQIFYGQTSKFQVTIQNDLTRKEWNCLLPLIFWILFLGLHPQILINTLQLS